MISGISTKIMTIISLSTFIMILLLRYEYPLYRHRPAWVAIIGCRAISDDSPLRSQGGAKAEAVSTSAYALNGTPAQLDFGCIPVRGWHFIWLAVPRESSAPGFRHSSGEPSRAPRPSWRRGRAEAAQCCSGDAARRRAPRFRGWIERRAAERARLETRRQHPIAFFFVPAWRASC
jgi:hypothetical protein